MEQQAPFEQDSVVPQGNNICSDDYISELPDDIVSYIFSFLSMKEAFRTRLVSRKWRYLSVPVLNLKLNYKFIFNSKYTGYDFYQEKSKLWQFESDYVRKVDQYLKMFPGKKLVSFDINFYSPRGNEFASHVDEWISFAVRMEAERIVLRIHLSTPLYIFPCHLLPYGGGTHLKFLHLRGCPLRPPLELVNRLSSLKSLVLDTIDLDERDMDAILSGCSSLESLGLRDCYLISTLRLDGQVPQLKWLFVDYCPNLRNIEINSVGLERFEYKGPMARFTFSELPPLTNVFLWFINPFKMGMDYIFKCLPRDFPHIQNLTLSWFSHMAVIPARKTTFGCLKHLHLILFLSSDFDLLSVTDILNASPVLEKFRLSLHGCTFQGGIKEKRYSSRQHLQLKEVTISGFRNRWNAVKLAIYVLKNAVALERMIINLRSNTYHGGEIWTYSDLSNWEKLTPEEIHDLLFKEKVNPTTQLIIK